MAHPFISGDQVWCPACAGYVRMLRVPKAASLADVSRRTVYRYIERGGLYALKVAGGAYRVCGHCLLRERHRVGQELEGRMK